MGLQRRHVNYQGSVQGVGFRFTARQLAQDFAVTGYVRNLPDGSVELVAEGDHEEIDRFLERLQRRMGGVIQHTGQQVSAHRNEFRGFGVRH